MPAFLSALLTVALAGVVSLAAYTDTLLVAFVVLLAQCMIASGPPATNERGRRIRTPMFTAVLLAALTALAVSVYPEFLSGADGLESGRFALVSSGVVTGVQLGLVVAFFAGFVAQMLRKDGRDNLVRSFSHTVMVALFAVLGVGWIGASHAYPSMGIVAMAATGMAVGVLLWQIPRFEMRNAVLSALVSAAGVLVPLIVGAIGAWFVGQQVGASAGVLVSLLLGGMAALVGIMGHDIGDALCESVRHGGPKWGFVGAMPFVFVAPLAYLASQVPGI